MHTILHVDVITFERNIKKALRLCIRLHTFLSKFGTFFPMKPQGEASPPPEFVRGERGVRPPLYPPLVRLSAADLWLPLLFVYKSFNLYVNA